MVIQVEFTQQMLPRRCFFVLSMWNDAIIVLSELFLCHNYVCTCFVKDNCPVKAVVKCDIIGCRLYLHRRLVVFMHYSMCLAIYSSCYMVHCHSLGISETVKWFHVYHIPTPVQPNQRKLFHHTRNKKIKCPHLLNFMKGIQQWQMVSRHTWLCMPNAFPNHEFITSVLQYLQFLFKRRPHSIRDGAKLQVFPFLCI